MQALKLAEAQANVTAAIPIGYVSSVLFGQDDTTCSGEVKGYRSLQNNTCVYPYRNTTGRSYTCRGGEVGWSTCTQGTPSSSFTLENSSMCVFSLEGRFREVKSCEEATYTRSGLWCGIYQFESTDCSGEYLKSDILFEAGRCTPQEGFVGTYNQRLELQEETSVITFRNKCFPTCDSNCPSTLIPFSDPSESMLSIKKRQCIAGMPTEFALNRTSSYWWDCFAPVPPPTIIITTPIPLPIPPPPAVLLDLIMLGESKCLVDDTSSACFNLQKQSRFVDSLSISLDINKIFISLTSVAHVTQVNYRSFSSSEEKVFHHRQQQLKASYTGGAVYVKLKIDAMSDDDAIAIAVAVLVALRDGSIQSETNRQLGPLRAGEADVSVTDFSSKSVLPVAANGTILSVPPSSFPSYRDPSRLDAVDNCASAGTLDSLCSFHYQCMAGLFCKRSTCRPCDECRYDGDSVGPSPTNILANPPDFSCPQWNCPSSPTCQRVTVAIPQGSTCPEGCPPAYDPVWMPPQCSAEVPDSQIDASLTAKIKLDDCGSNLGNLGGILGQVLGMCFAFIAGCFFIKCWFDAAQEDVREHKACVRDGIYRGPE